MQFKTIKEFISEAQELRRKDKLDEAIQVINESISLYPISSANYKQMALTLVKQKKLSAAINAYQKSIDIKPDIRISQKIYNIYLELAKELLQQNKIEEVIKINHILINLDQNNKFLFDYPNYNKKFSKLQIQIGNFYLQKKELDLAVKYFSEAINYSPNIGESYAKLRLIFISMKFQSSAIKDVINVINKAIEKNIKLPLAAYTNLGDFLSLQNNIKKAIYYYQYSARQNTLNAVSSLPEKEIILEQHIKPEFSIIGAMKGGTTSLYQYITQHPHVIPAIKKEIHFFDKNHQKGIDWYLSHFPFIINNRNYISGEASPGYLTNDIGKYILELFPNMKIICLLRNPVERSISHYFHNVKLGYEKNSIEHAMGLSVNNLSTFSKLSTLEEREKLLKHNSYINHSLYAYHLEKWLNIIPLEQILIIKSEDLFESPEETVSKIVKFLGIKEFNNIQYKAYNSGTYFQKVSSDIIEDLSSAFMPYNSQLIEKLGININWHNQ
ncbi:sulfotransferase family protein [Xenococcus sp. PCC 7305]|uniref:tetratricopeptide repeat-containing sulfotransferase family protein n=1 Tax=Xenococcus sp. PCC 7305 TaxID=102125 RepID=UPI0002ACF0F7|nr:sulfotransferase [Xenococcus sp. PCC 7305]ELS04094.1 sulfotransferase family protein [Xenococcus sp. PCC 7305]